MCCGANTTTLANIGSTAHPAAHYAKSLTTGGYNTWYLPAKNELNTLYSNKSAVPFATDNSFVNSVYCTSTEYNGSYAYFYYFNFGAAGTLDKTSNTNYVRAVRRV